MAPKKKILVIEDNMLNREMLTEILSERYGILQAENGQEGLKILRQNKESISLVLLDIIMPVMDGFTFLDTVREDKELSLIPVIVTTQSDSESDEVAVLAHGATDFVPKPYRPQVILHRVASIIKLRETAAVINQLQYDRLTGLYSREYFYQKARERLLENPDGEYSIVCLNIENFKLYNDAFGKEAGDRLLRDCADNMKTMIGDTGICGRYGADRFMCLQERDVERSHRELFIKAASNADRPEKVKNLSVKWGIYEITDRSVPIEQMCDRALLAADSIKGMYNRFFAVYDDELRSKLLREKAITDAMETALREKQFEVYLQPKYSLNNECMAGAEALVRWIHPEWGFMSPGEFIPLFEKNAFISRLDKYVWERVCALLSEWKEKGEAEMPISVNVSRADIFQSDLAEYFTALTEKYGIAPSQLHLEITESAYAKNPSQIISTVNELRALGFVVEMDDFGSGYSSLSMLSQMNLDILKLDMKFIQNELAKPANHSVIGDVVAMAHRMHLSVVAEGVETKEQMKRLRAVGCDYVQGYYFAKPMPVAEFEKLLASQRRQARCGDFAPRFAEAELRGILIADENAKYREKVCGVFKGQYRIEEAADANTAAELIRTLGSRGISAVILSLSLPEKGAEKILRIMREDPAFWKIPVLATIPSGELTEEYPLIKEADDFLCKCHPTYDLHKRVERMMDIVELKEKETQLKDEAGKDLLTGLLNRRGLQEAVASLRMEDFPLAVYLFDLDDLKKINDTQGHDMGDRIIKAFALMLTQSVGEDSIICRYGGDEFTVIMKRFGSPEDAESKGNEICRSFRERLEKEGNSAACSCGAVLCEKNGMPYERIFEAADKALYRSKRKNKGGCTLSVGDGD